MPFKDYCDLTTTAHVNGGPKQYINSIKSEYLARGRAEVYPAIPAAIIIGYTLKSFVDWVRQYCKVRKENAELAEAIIQEEMQQENHRISNNWEV